MAAIFIPVSLSDFEKKFNIPSKKDASKRAFKLYRPIDSEAFYLCLLRETAAGKLYLKVYTSIPPGEESSRSCGKDAIRILLLWQDHTGWEMHVGEKCERVYRAGKPGTQPEEIVQRALDKARNLAMNKGTICKCGRPMVSRIGPHGKFLGCIGYGRKLCKEIKILNKD